MTNDLTPKQEKFVNEYSSNGGNGTKAAKAAYPAIATDNTAAVVANENLRKPKVQRALTELVADEDVLGDAYNKLLRSVRLDYFVFPKSMKDEEILEHVESVGLKCVNVRPSDKGKLAFFAIPDANAIKAALDLAAKITGRYAPEKRINVNIKAQPSDRIKELAEKLNA